MEQDVQLEHSIEAVVDNQQKLACRCTTYKIQHSRSYEELHGRAVLQYAHCKAAVSHGSSLGISSVSSAQVYTSVWPTTTEESFPQESRTASRILEK